MTTLSRDEIQFYSRHLIMPEVGLRGQEKLKKARVLLVGTGGLGSPAALYLAAAGVGTIGLVDFDTVDTTNLHRQVLYGARDVGRPKLKAATERLEDLNPHVTIVPHETRFDSSNALDILKDYDILLDGTDNFPTRYLANDAAVLSGKPNVYASIFRFDGQASVFGAPGGPCYRCLYAKPPPPGLVPSCAEGGVLGLLPGVMGVVQATEAVKLILGVGETLVGRLLLFDALAMEFTTLNLQKDPDCPLCGPKPTITGLIDYEEFCGIGPGATHAAADESAIEPDALKARLDSGERPVLLDVREPHEWEIARLPDAKLVPLGALAERASELSTADEIVTYCLSGARSARAASFLRTLGFRKVKNLSGGIRAWAEKVDPEMPRY